MPRTQHTQPLTIWHVKRSCPFHLGCTPGRQLNLNRASKPFLKDQAQALGHRALGMHFEVLICMLELEV